MIENNNRIIEKAGEGKLWAVLKSNANATETYYQEGFCLF